MFVNAWVGLLALITQFDVTGVGVVTSTGEQHQTGGYIQVEDRYSGGRALGWPVGPLDARPGLGLSTSGETALPNPGLRADADDDAGEPGEPDTAGSLCCIGFGECFMGGGGCPPGFQPIPCPCDSRELHP